MATSQTTPTKSRIRWEEPLRQQLANETATTLQTWGVTAEDFTTKRMMQAFRAAMNAILTEDQRRPISGPSVVPWLEEMVRIRLTSPPPEPSQDIPTDTTDLILDTLTSLEQKLNDFIHTQTETTQALVNAITNVGGNVRELGETILKARKRAAERQAQRDREKAIRLASVPVATPLPPPLPAVKPLRVTVAGIERGDQKRHIENAVMGFPNVQVTFDDTNRGVSQIPYCDELIVMHWVPARWQNTALHLFAGRTHIANGIKKAIDLIHRIGQQHSKKAGHN